MKAKIFLTIFLTAALPALLLAAAGCGDDATETSTHPVRTQTSGIVTTPASTAPAAPTGIVLDPNLQSKTGTPAANEMPVLIDLQKKVPYPVVVPTQLPSGLRMDTDLVGSSSTAGDPVGYYSFRYSQPDNASRTLTFNQSRANAQPLSGYYLTETTIGGIDYQVYWHRTRDYLPDGAPVRTTQVGNAETFIVVWKGQYKDAAGQPQDLYYSLTTGTWTGWDYGNIRNILESLKPLSDVGT